MSKRSKPIGAKRSDGKPTPPGGRGEYADVGVGRPSRSGATHVIDTSGGAKLTHNPFAALAGAPSGPAAAPPDTAPIETPALTGAEPIRFAPKVVVRREKKGRGGKTITRIAGIDAAHREHVAGRMKSALGCGAVVEGEDVVLLGALVERAADWLEEQGAKRVVRS